MSGEFIQFQTGPQAPGPDPGLSGIMVGRVVTNCDLKRLGRVQVRLAARGGIEMWVRVALLNTGAYFIPQQGDEVLVAFQSDGNEGYIIGRLWNENKKPPRSGDGDPTNQRVLRTPSGHEIAFDEEEKSLVITTSAGQYIEMRPGGIKVVADKQGGNITLEASAIELRASKLTLGNAETKSINIG